MARSFWHSILEPGMVVKDWQGKRKEILQVSPEEVHWRFLDGNGEEHTTSYLAFANAHYISEEKHDKAA